ncbi:MAG TPA: sulfotransferase [Fimbriimonadaceae bacterium]|jgi:tetratricopeptide (TPR) repeat protein
MLPEYDSTFSGLLAAGVGKRRGGDLQGAVEILKHAVHIAPGEASVYSELGACYLSMRDSVAAVGAFTKLLRLQPANPRGYFGLGMSLKHNGSSYEAFHAFRKATELDPDFVPAFTELFAQSQHLLNWAEAFPPLELGHHAHPKSIAISVAFAVTCGKLKMAAKAEALFKAAAEANPMASTPFAHWLHEEGRFDEAQAILLATIAGDPSLGEAFHALAVAKCFDLGEQRLLDAALAGLKRTDLRPEARMFFLYAAAKAYDEIKDPHHAISYYDQANKAAYDLYNSPLKLSGELAELSLQAVRGSYPKARIEELGRFGSSSETPVFIVGMIRSGTTLLDQILFSHGLIASAGEQPFWVLNAPRMEYKWRNGEPDPGDIRRAGEKYLEALFHAGGTAKKVIDKMPVNYRHLGLIRSTFPRAKIIHLRRDPMDTCLSIYTTYLGNATYFAYDQANIVQNYREYLAFMEHWRSCLPQTGFIEIDYEDLVSNKEPIIRSLVSFLGLEWDEACLRHEQNERQVSTPSLFTARQEVNIKSVGRWRQYETWIGELASLKDVHHPRPQTFGRQPE